MNNTQKRNLVLLAFVLLKLVLQYFAINPAYELHRDEFLHLDLGKHLAWGYTSVPPVTGWNSWLIQLLGNSVFWVKFFPALYGALTLVLGWKIIETLKGGWTALIIGASAVTFSILLRINTLYQPNSLEFLLWTAVYFALIRFFESDKNRYLWLAVVFFAFGFLNKYNIAFLALGLVPALAICKQRSVFKNKHLYWALLLALVIVLPNLVWQWQNNFPVIHHMSELASTQLVNVNRFDFWSEQLFFFTGSLLVLLLAFVGFFIYEPFKKYRFLFWAFLITMAFYTYLHAKAYYAIGLYPVLIAFGAVYLEKITNRRWLKWLRGLAIVSPVLSILVAYQILLPVWSPEKIIENQEKFRQFGSLRWEDGVEHHMPQDFADMLGWTELAVIVDSVYNAVDDKEHTLIHCDNYGEAGAINFYSKLDYTAYSMNADYIYWYPLHELEVKHIILVKDSNDNDPERKREAEFFDEVKLMGYIRNPYAREKGTNVYFLKGARIDVNAVLQQEIDKKIVR